MQARYLGTQDYHVFKIGAAEVNRINKAEDGVSDGNLRLAKTRGLHTT